MDLVDKYLGEAKYTMYWKKRSESKFKKVVEFNTYKKFNNMMGQYQAQLAQDNQLPVGNINVIVVDNSKNKVVDFDFNLPGKKHPSYEKEFEKVKKVINKNRFSIEEGKKKKTVIKGKKIIFDPEGAEQKKALGRMPTAKKTQWHKDKSKYDRKQKHKKKYI